MLVTLAESELNSKRLLNARLRHKSNKQLGTEESRIDDDSHSIRY